MKAVIRTGYLFLVLGVIMLIIALFVLNNKQQFVKNSMITTGKVINVEKRQSTDSEGHTSYSYYPVCVFQTENQELITFVSKTGSGRSKYDVEDEVEIRYDPSDPSHAEINSFFRIWMLPVILGAMGLVFFLIGGGLVLTRWKNKKKRQRLMFDGTRIQTKFVEVEKNTNLTVNGKHPYRIITNYEKNDELYVFKSENIWFNPSQFITTEEIDVYVDPMEMKKYYMDISFLPKKM